MTRNLTHVKMKVIESKYLINKIILGAMQKEFFLEERRQEILKRINQEGRASVTELSQALGVSEVTIRVDLQALADRVAERHGERDAPVIELAKLHQDFASELESHMMKEERILFPEIRQRAETVVTAGSLGPMSMKMRVMEAEHDDAGGARECGR